MRSDVPSGHFPDSIIHIVVVDRRASGPMLCFEVTAATTTSDSGGSSRPSVVRRST